MNFFFVIVLSAMLCCCRRSEKDMAGVYLKSPSVNTIDSLIIYAGSRVPTPVYNRTVYKYKQRFYNRKTGVLLFENESTWWMDDNGRLELNNLYVDTDNNPDEFSHTAEAIKNAVISSSLPIQGNKIMVDEDRNMFYRKIK